MVSPEKDTESGSGTPEHPAANQPAGGNAVEQVGVGPDAERVEAGSRDPQAASAGRVEREAEIGGSGVVGLGATAAQGPPDPAAAPVGANQPDLAVADTGAGVPVDPGRKDGAPNHTETVGAQRRHAPDGEVGPA